MPSVHGDQAMEMQRGPTASNGFEVSVLVMCLEGSYSRMDPHSMNEGGSYLFCCHWEKRGLTAFHLVFVRDCVICRAWFLCSTQYVFVHGSQNQNPDTESQATLHLFNESITLVAVMSMMSPTLYTNNCAAEESSGQRIDIAGGPTGSSRLSFAPLCLRSSIHARAGNPTRGANSHYI